MLEIDITIHERINMLYIAARVSSSTLPALLA
jgi:hypothetical protein